MFLFLLESLTRVLSSFNYFDPPAVIDSGRELAEPAGPAEY